ncbi:hypothetical protein ACFL96_09845 [Thermoproteota archaeon]
MVQIVHGDVSTANSHTSSTKDSCDDCHQVSGTRTFDSSLIYSECVDSCHSDENSAVSSSGHSSIGCRCHSVLHVGHGRTSCLGGGGCHSTFYGGGPNRPYSYDNFKHLFFLNKVGYKGSGTSDLGDNFFEYSDSELDTKLGISSSDTYKIYMAYVDPYGDSVGTSFVRYLTCFNCHFVTTDLGQAAPLKPESDNKYIPIPEETMWGISDAHSIGKLKDYNLNGEDIGVEQRSDYIQITYIIPLVIIALIFLMWIISRR